MKNAQTKNKMVLTFAFLTTILTLGFQNCSPTQFSKADESSVDATGSISSVIRSLQPTLAVRAMGCIQCHAQVASNLVTDFGYGDAYYFGQKDGASNWNANSPYGDHMNSFNTVSMSAGQTVYVPSAVAPNVVKQNTGATTLAAYVGQQFSQSADAATQNTKIQQLKSVYIGAPADSDLIAAFNLKSSERFQYHPSAQATGGLSGIQDKGGFFKNSDEVSCDGDLVLRGPLYLENLTLNSVAGCRIYVLGSVFIYGPIKYSNSSAKTNLQITSTKSISLGLGAEIKNGQDCEPTSRYATQKSDSNYSKSNSMNTRFVDIYTVPLSYVRADGGDPRAFGNSILAEAATIASSVGTLYDASCRPEGRSVAFEKILLNAPLIHSRYVGDIKGTIVGEYVMAALSQFKFEFDPVFNNVDVLPYLSANLFLHQTK